MASAKFPVKEIPGEPGLVVRLGFAQAFQGPAGKSMERIQAKRARPEGRAPVGVEMAVILGLAQSGAHHLTDPLSVPTSLSTWVNLVHIGSRCLGGPTCENVDYR